LKSSFEMIVAHNKKIALHENLQNRRLFLLYKIWTNPKHQIKSLFDRWKFQPKVKIVKTFPDILDNLDESNLLEYSNRSFLSPGKNIPIFFINRFPVQNAPQTQMNSFIDRSQNSCFSYTNEKQIRLQFLFTLLNKNIHNNLFMAFQDLKLYDQRRQKHIFKERLVSLLGLVLKNKVCQQLNTAFRTIQEKA